MHKDKKVIKEFSLILININTYKYENYELLVDLLCED